MVVNRLELDLRKLLDLFDDNRLQVFKKEKEKSSRLAELSDLTRDDLKGFDRDDQANKELARASELNGSGVNKEKSNLKSQSAKLK